MTKPNLWTKRSAAAALTAMALSIATQADAVSTATTTFQVQASISSACSATAGTLNFGTYNPSSGSPNDATSTINVYCTSGTAYTLKLNVGTGGGTLAARTLADGASDTLGFNLYTTTGRTVVWGDGSGSTGTVSGTGAGLLTASPQTVFGRMAAGQDKPAGSYASTITVTVEYT